MANVQHLYRGAGNPNDNPALELAGDAVGNHLYQDTDNPQSIWMSTAYEEEGQVYHAEWVRLFLEVDMGLFQIEYNQPLFEGQMGVGPDGETLFIVMYDPDSDYAPRWRSTGITLGNWYEEPT